ncbi:hypothetical protein [Streptomyces sp. NBC_00631]|uniref:hypothetical protein n=1 Tax=Streptomyces sp. NBC_00631 TaxID=2975793 RepID=UPI00386C99AA
MGRRPADLSGQLPVPGSAGGLGALVPDGREISRCQGVQLIGNFFQIHSYLPTATRLLASSP